jgi:hypothetical protein
MQRGIGAQHLQKTTAPQMLCNRGQLNGKRILGPCAVKKWFMITFEFPLRTLVFSARRTEV